MLAIFDLSAAIATLQILNLHKIHKYHYLVKKYFLHFQ